MPTLFIKPENPVPDVLRLLSFLSQAHEYYEGAFYYETLWLLEEVLKIEAGNAEALNNKTATLEALMDLEDTPAALTCINRMLMDHATDSQFLSTRVELLNNLAKELYRDALEKEENSTLANSLFESVIHHCETALAIDPNNYPALRMKYNTLYKLNRDAEALATVEIALALRENAENPDPSTDKSSMLISLGRHEEALAPAQHALSLAIRHGHGDKEAPAFKNMIIALSALGHEKEALALSLESIVRHPGNKKLLNQRAKLLYQQGQTCTDTDLRKTSYLEAFGCCNAALKEDPLFYPALETRLSILIAYTDLHEAITTCERMLAIAPDDTHIQEQRKILLIKLKGPTYLPAAADTEEPKLTHSSSTMKGSAAAISALGVLSVSPRGGAGGAEAGEEAISTTRTTLTTDSALSR